MLPALLCLIVGVTDGDTLTARCDAPESPITIQVRLAEIDAPEKRQPFGERSKQHLSTLCFGKAAVVTPRTRDRYGRTVARVACDGVDASSEMVRSGMAWAFTKYLTDPSIAAVERDARGEHVGLWADAVPTPPWEWRKSLTTRQRNDL
jgi:micrococcal nuclease